MGLFRFLWRKKALIVFGLAVGIGIGWFIQNRPEPESPYETEMVERRTIVQEVSATGTIEPTAKITLRFPLSGTIDSIPVEVGDVVSKGDILVALDKEELAFSVSAAQAELAAAQADYAQASAGSTSEAVKVAQAAVNKAEADLNQAEDNLESQEQLGDQSIALADLVYDSAVSDYENAVETYELEVTHAYENGILAIDDALNQAEDSLRELDDLLAVDHEPSDPGILNAIRAHSSSKYTSAVNSYKALSSDYETLSDTLQTLESNDEESILDALDSTSGLLEDVNDLIEDVDALVQAAPIVDDFDDIKRSDTRALLASQKTAAMNAQSTLSNQEQAIESILNEQETQLQQADNAVEQAEQDVERAMLEKDANVSQAEASISVYESLLSQAKASLAEVRSGPRYVDLASLSAGIDRAETQLERARHDLSLATIEAPTEGVVTEIYFEERETVNTAEDVIQVVSTEYHILANIPESDITKLDLGDPVAMTLDAFAYDQQFEGAITEIDPSETVVEGVVYYQIKASFTLPYEDIKPGMTANMDILTAEEKDVVAIPLRALKYDDDRIYVQVLDLSTQTVKEMEVQLGIRDDQYVQILGGLEEGDTIVTLIHETL